MRALLDTNIIIHRENKRVSNYSIGHLFRWLDKLKYDKVIHPYSISEIKKYRDPETQEAISVKLESYEVIKTIKEPDDSFLELIGIPEKSQNDMIDDCLLFEVYSNRVDILITEDRRLRNKAIKLGLSDRVFSINAFISAATAENPSLIEYKMLAVEKTYFGNVDLTDSFFDSFRIAYPGFDKWFARKCDEEAYICNTDAGKVLGFLYLKTEGVDENYSDIVPPFKPMRRLKVGTFKVESTGFRLGERFVKIIFDNALQRNVDEIYVTLYTDREELSALAALLKRWGFTKYGVKIGNGKEEQVLVKRMKDFDHNISFRKNKKYTSVVTTVAMVDEIISNIHSQEELLSICQNRSVFSTEELKGFWRDHRRNLKVLKFIFVKSLSKRLTLGYLWDHDIVCAPRGPRSFMKLSDEQYNQIMHDSETEIKYVE